MSVDQGWVSSNPHFFHIFSNYASLIPTGYVKVVSNDGSGQLRSSTLFSPGAPPTTHPIKQKGGKDKRRRFDVCLKHKMWLW
jgi:hypothetical protein